VLQKTKHFGYQFRFFTDFDKNEKFALWRHDVDFSVHAAKKLALIEAEEGVISTYFLHLHSEFYNLLEAEVFNRVKDIIGLGHQIGLHFDTHFYNIQDATLLDEKIRFEADFLGHLLGTPIKVFSFHNTTPFIMGCKAPNYGGLINTYASYFQENVTYCSDSNGYWRFKRLTDVIEENHPRIQILTHPAWWQENPMAPRQRILNCVEGRDKKSIDYYDSLLAINNKLNINNKNE
jgi:hypothetical protein